MTNKEFNKILSKLERDPNTGKIIEKIQIYTHSRGAAFGQGYTQKLMEMIKAHSDKFADDSNVVSFSYNMAPNESWGVSAVNGVETYGQSHTKDWLSGTNMSGSVNFSSDEGDGGLVPEAHTTGSFVNDLNSFLSSFSSGSDNQNLINNFISRMQKKYGIKVNVEQ